MAIFLNTNAACSQIDQLVTNARKQLVLISPYWQIPPMTLERLRNAAERNVSLTLIFGKKAISPMTQEQLCLIPNITVYYSTNLHAKCYFNEQTMIVTSMNLIHASEKSNWEMGFLLDRETDKELYNAALVECRLIKRSAEPIDLKCDMTGLTLDYHGVRKRNGWWKRRHDKRGTSFK